MVQVLVELVGWTAGTWTGIFSPLFFFNLIRGWTRAAPFSKTSAHTPRTPHTPAVHHGTQQSPEEEEKSPGGRRRHLRGGHHRRRRHQGKEPPGRCVVAFLHLFSFFSLFFFLKKNLQPRVQFFFFPNHVNRVPCQCAARDTRTNPTPTREPLTRARERERERERRRGDGVGC